MNGAYRKHCTDRAPAVRRHASTDRNQVPWTANVIWRTCSTFAAPPPPVKPRVGTSRQCSVLVWFALQGPQGKPLYATKNSRFGVNCVSLAWGQDDAGLSETCDHGPGQATARPTPRVTAKPPLLVKIHGGPTSAASTAYNLRIQYWTSRGYTVADVNYGGSTGYGREYRDRLKGNWGVVDVDDCTNIALHLVDIGEVDKDMLCIDGGSAGGYTTLACLAFKDVFKAGASHYGVSDLCALAADTHKFESRCMCMRIEGLE